MSLFTIIIFNMPLLLFLLLPPLSLYFPAPLPSPLLVFLCTLIIFNMPPLLFLPLPPFPLNFPASLPSPESQGRPRCGGLWWGGKGGGGGREDHYGIFNMHVATPPRLNGKPIRKTLTHSPPLLYLLFLLSLLCLFLFSSLPLSWFSCSFSASLPLAPAS